MSSNLGSFMQAFVVAAAATAVVSCVLGIALWGCPRYRVWQQEMAGKAELRRAEWNRQIRVKEAEAHKESARQYAAAEEIRARGVAKANTIIGDSLKGNEAYLRYLWINGLHDGTSEVIYIPTEAGLPLLEAGKR